MKRCNDLCGISESTIEESNDNIDFVGEMDDEEEDKNETKPNELHSDSDTVGFVAGIDFDDI